MSRKNDNVTDFKSGMNDWEEEDEAIMNEIRRQSDDVEVPEGLLPENMMKKIKQESIKTGKDTQKKEQKKLWNARFMRRAVSLVTAAAVCIVALYQLPNIKGTATLTNLDSHSKGIVYGKIENMAKASSQDEIYNKLKVDTRYKSEWGFGIARDDVSDSKAETSDNSMTNESINKEGDYYKDTNEQVEGVSEGDQVKTDGKYIYVASNKKDEIKIMSANKGNVENVSKIEYKSIVENNIVKDLGLLQEEILNVTVHSKEMYINGDILTLILNTSAQTETEYKNGTYYCYDYYYYLGNNITYILSYDISDRNEPELLAKHSQEGSLNTSRVAEGYLYVISEMYDSLYENMDRLIPYVDGMEAELNSVYVNENGGGRYTVITALEIAQPEKFLSNINVITGAGIIYVSPENIYIAESYYSTANIDAENNRTKEINSYDTIINKFKFKSGKLSFEASAKIKGQVDDQFLMDEYDGTLRVVANSREYTWEYYHPLVELFIEDDYIGNSEIKHENLVYVMDEQLNIIGQIDGIAKNENLYSARFMGDTGYFVTYESVDPLFAVDFSDKTNPKIISELKVPGFSTYLHFWEEDKLLGIGNETESTGGRTRTIGCKFSMFDISNPSNVTEENKLVVNNSSSDALYDYKSILISKEKNIIGVAMQVYDYPEEVDVVRTKIGRYVLYSYDEEQGFVQTFRYNYDVTTKQGQYRELRGIIINDVFYLITIDENIMSYDISQDYKPISTLNY